MVVTVQETWLDLMLENLLAELLASLWFAVSVLLERELEVWLLLQSRD